MSTNVEQIKEKLSIEEVIGGYIKLDRIGGNLKARCPFHNEKTPSFFVSPDRGNYYCFGCGAKGDIFTFVQEFEGLDFMGALKLLAEKSGVSLTFSSNEEKGEKEKIYDILEKATAFFERNLKESSNSLEYLKKRGAKDETISSFRLGYAKDEWRGLYDHFTSLGFKEDILLKAGLIKEAEKGGRKTYYDTFRGRILFPLSDSAGRVVAFSGRIFPAPESDSAPKYLNSPDSQVFHKSKVLFGFDRAKSAIRKVGYTVLVEGQMDLVMCHQSGFLNTVATSGTSLTEEHLKSILRFSPNLLLAYDADSAGLRASERAVMMALSLGMSVKIAPLPKGKDPADLIKEDENAWREAVKKSSHIIDFYVDTLVAENLSPRELGKEIRVRVLPFVKKISSSIEQSEFIKSIAYKTSIREEALWEDTKKVQEENPTVGKDKEEKTTKDFYSRSLGLEKRLLGIIKWQEKEAKPKIDISFAKEEVARITKNKYEEILKGIEKADEDELVLEAQILYGGEMSLERAVKDILLSIEEEYLKKDFAKAMENLARVEKEGKKEERDILLNECKIISSRINEIKTRSRDIP